MQNSAAYCIILLTRGNPNAYKYMESTCKNSHETVNKGVLWGVGLQWVPFLLVYNLLLSLDIFISNFFTYTNLSISIYL